MTDRAVGRREFLCSAGAFVVALTTRSRSVYAAAPRPLVIALLESSRATREQVALDHGVQLSYEESRRSGAMLGRQISVFRVRYATTEQPSDAAERASKLGATVLIGGVTVDQTSALARFAAQRGLLYMNAASSSDSLRATCSQFLFHVAPSDAMIRSTRVATAIAWHSTLERYGAAQLNDRFEARFGSGLDSIAWAGWFAVKAVWEASLRVRSTDPRVLAGYLSRETTQFDGHKGAPLSFRSWDHQLRQPLYVVSGSRVTAEIPDAAKEPGVPLKSLLDRIGETRATTRCRMSP